MSRFKAVLVEHGYSSVQYERDIIEAANGEFVDCDKLPLAEAWPRCRDADAVMVRRVQVTPELISQLTNCRILLRYGVGVDNIDLAAATRAGIIVGHVPIYCQDEVSTHAICLMLACVRRLVPTLDKMRVGGWDVHRVDPIYRLAGKTIGLIGLGTLGQATARKLQTWNVRLLAADPYLDESIAGSLNVSLVPMNTLLAESDIISLHVPLLPETTHLINDRTLTQMKRGSVLVNTARGPVVDGASVLWALDSGQLSCAALDVFEEEPLPPNTPLRSHPRLLVTDHTAWYSEESQIELQQRAAREVVRACTGSLPEAIANPEVLSQLGRAAEWTPNHLATWQHRRSQELKSP
ncbi:MAG TPA: C-terminal binding protein [Verrucomicrobiae bacterium]